MPDLVPIRYDQTGLRGHTAILLTELPTDDAGVPVKLPPGTTHVMIVDDTPNPTLTLQVHPVGNPQCVVYIDHAELALTEPQITYYAILGADRTRENPSGLIRRIHTSPRTTDEAFGRNMHWHPTEYLRKYFLGHNDDDHEEISAEEAQAVIARWRAKWSREDGL